MPSRFVTTTGADGKYEIFTITNRTDTLTAHPNSRYAVLTTPDFLLDTAASKDIGVYIRPNMGDLCITYSLATPFRPGFDNQLLITVTNVGTVPIAVPEAVLHLVPELEYISASPAPSVVNSTEVRWQLPPLEPDASHQVWVVVKVPAIVPIGTVFTLATTVHPTDDEYPANNHYGERHTVVGSFDPNDKACHPAHLSPQMVADSQQLHYTIRFQNTGNYPATFVRILDTLEAGLDPTTVRITGASHPYTWTLRGEGILDFFFDNINLPDSTADEPGSHGFVSFTIGLSRPLAIGQGVSNSAAIYFDYNPPVITNTVQTAVQEPLGLPDRHALPGSLKVTPNPATVTALLEITGENLPEGPYRLSVFDAEGRLFRTLAAVGRVSELSVEGWPKGTYRLVAEREGRMVVGVMLVR